MARPGLRPALEVEFDALPSPSTRQVETADLVAVLVDDFRPFAIEPLEERSYRVHFSDPGDRDDAAQALRAGLGPSGVTVRTVDVTDDGATWAARTQNDLTAIRVGRVVIAPPWDPTPAPDGGIAVVIRPSRGFGTGHHATTRLCVRALLEASLVDRPMIDVGTGSGVLAVVAAKLGASAVEAFDNDPDALDCARESVAANGVADRVTLSHRRLGTDPTPSPAPVVAANLTGTTLSRHADQLAACATPGGRLVLSGLTPDERDGVRHAFAPYAFQVDDQTEDDWSCLILETR